MMIYGSFLLAEGRYVVGHVKNCFCFSPSFAREEEREQRKGLKKQ